MRGCDHDGRLYQPEFLNTIAAKDEAELAAEAKRLFGDRAEEFLSFPESRARLDEGLCAPVSGIELSVKSVLGDVASTGRKGYCYCFDPDIPGWDDPGTFHSSDLWFWFETLAKCWRPFVGRHYDLARQMCDYFCSFIRTGDPNGRDLNGEPLPAWAPWSGENPCEMRFTGDGAVPETGALTPFRRFLADRIAERIRSIPVE